LARDLATRSKATRTEAVVQPRDRHNLADVPTPNSAARAAPPCSRGRQAWARWRDLYVAGDPGGFSARAAGRALLSLLGTGGMLLALRASVTAALLASVLGMVTSVAVVDARAAAQALTMAMAFAAALGTVCVAVLVSVSPWAAGATLCAVVFLAVLARGLGPRGTAVGMLGFMGYFFAVFIGARPAQVPGLALAIAVGAAVAFAVRFAVVPERAASVQGRVLRAFAARMRMLLDDLAAELESDQENTRRLRRIRRETGRINEVALALEESAMERGSAAQPPKPVRSWLLHIMRAEVALDLLADAVHRIARREWSAEARWELAAAIRLLGRWVGEGGPSLEGKARRRLAGAREHTGAAAVGVAGDSVLLARRTAVWSLVDRAMALLLASRPWEEIPPAAVARQSLSPTSFRSGGGGTAGLGDLRPNLRLAIQTTIAVALAIVAGRAISSTRWYWAVIAAFTVYARAATVAETLSRAWQRILGTAVGVIVAVGVAELLRRHALPAAIVALGAAAVAYGLLRVSYAAMILFLTIALALLYELLGRPVPGLMALRLAESGAGVVIGAVVASIVLPRGTAERLRRLVAEVLRQSAGVIAAGTRPGLEPEQDWGFLDAIRRVDRALAEVRNALRPLWAPQVPIETARFSTPGRAAAALAYTTRRFVIDVRPGAVESERLERLGRQLAGACRAAADALDRNEAPQIDAPAGELPALMADTTAPHTEARRAAIELLGDLDAALRRLLAATAPITRGRRQ
jgi:uncharacterized membrane protein YccC